MNEYRDKLKTIGVVTKAGTSRESVTKAENAIVLTREHWDGRQDATVRPEAVRYGARTHSMGSKKGEVAEVSKLTDKERKSRYGR